MATSLLEYKAKGFYVHDSFLGAIYCLLLNEINGKIKNPNEFDKLIHDLKIGIAGYYDGAVDLNLDAYDDKIINLLKELLVSIIQRDYSFSNDKDFNAYLNNCRNKLLNVNENYFDVDISSVKKLNEFFLDLLTDNLDCKEERTVNFLDY